MTTCLQKGYKARDFFQKIQNKHLLTEHFTQFPEITTPILTLSKACEMFPLGPSKPHVQGILGYVV